MSHSELTTGGPDASARVRSLFWMATGVALIISMVGFFALADMIQFVVHFPREFTFAVWGWRTPLIVIFVVTFLTSMVLGLGRHAAPRWLVVGCALLNAGLFLGGFVNAPYLMFRSQHSGAEYVTVREAIEELGADEEASVIVIGDEAVAFPYRWINQPHIAGATIGGEDVVLTWCGLSHLGLGFKTEVPGEDMGSCSLMVLTQLENNLVMFDSETGEPIQQIYGTMRDSGRELERVPTIMMTLGAFAELWPEGEVFHAPVTNPWDRLTQAMMFPATEQNYDRSDPDFSFPTIAYFDERTHAKEQVYGLVVGGEPIAFTRAYIEERGGTVLAEHGGTKFTVKLFPEHDVVDVFHGHVPDVDVRGRVGDDRVARLPHASRVLWAVWANFYRDTWLNDRPPARAERTTAPERPVPRVPR